MRSEEFKFTSKPIDLLSVFIEGDRINLYSISEQYADIIFKEFTEEIARFMYPETPGSIEDTLDFINESKKKMESCKDLVLAVIKKENNEFLGCCGLHIRGKVEAPELGIWIKKSQHGHKYGQEAIKLFVDWVEENIDCDYLVYPVDRNNFSSRKIPESLNGVIFKEVKTKTMHNTYLDEVVYRIPVNVRKKRGK